MHKISARFLKGVWLLTGISLIISFTACTSNNSAITWKSSSKVLKHDLEISLAPELSSGSNGSYSFTIQGDLLEGATFHGTAHRESDNWTLTFASMNWFNNWAQGWTEAHFIVEGSIVLQPTQSTTEWKISIKDFPSIDVPEFARIRFNDTYLYGDNATQRLANRWDRINAAVDWLRTKQPEIWYDWPLPHFEFATFSWVNDFSTGVRRLLFPEVYGWESATPINPSSNKVLAESVLWDTDYTKQAFPERLRPVRDSGTLLRDWEENTGLWYLAFSWKALWEQKLVSVVFDLQNF